MVNCHLDCGELLDERTYARQFPGSKQGLIARSRVTSGSEPLERLGRLKLCGHFAGKDFGTKRFELHHLRSRLEVDFVQVDPEYRGIDLSSQCTESFLII